jgi:hypothetical protein
MDQESERTAMKALAADILATLLRAEEEEGPTDWWKKGGRVLEPGNAKEEEFLCFFFPNQRGHPKKGAGLVSLRPKG